MGWFFGFKLHLVINERGELQAFALTPGHVDDRKPVPGLARALWGKLMGDKGSISQALGEELYARGLRLRTRLRSNMKPKLATLADHWLLGKRAWVESVNDQLKHISQIEHTRHRSPVHFLVNLLLGLIACCHQPQKPSLTRKHSLPETAAYP